MPSTKKYAQEYVDNCRIAVHEVDFDRLCDAFFDEIEAKYL